MPDRPQPRLMATGSLEAEDVVLGVWNLVAIPVGTAVAGSWQGSEPAPLLGLVEVAAVLLAIAAMATRPAVIEGPAGEFRTWILSGPLVGALALVGQSGAERLGIPGTEVVLGIALLIGLGAIAFGDRLPVVDRGHRRLLVLPLILIAAGVFQDIGTDLVEGLDPGALVAGFTSGAGVSSQELTLAGLVAGVVVLGSAVFFAMLIVAPRELADPEPRPSVWLLRFVLFLVSAATGIGIWSLI
jgi:hypothetical protein